MELSNILRILQKPMIEKVDLKNLRLYYIYKCVKKTFVILRKVNLKNLEVTNILLKLAKENS